MYPNLYLSFKKVEFNNFKKMEFTLIIPEILIKIAASNKVLVSDLVT